MRPADNIDDLIKKLQLKASADLDVRVHDDISKALAGHEKTRSVRSEPSVWRIIMKGKTAKLAVAAVILVGVLVLTSVFVGTNKSVVLAGVLEKVEQAQAYMYKIDMTFTESTNPQRPMKQKIEGTIVVSNEYGIKSEMHERWEVDADVPNPKLGKTKTKIRYILPKQKLDVLIKPDQKTYLRTELDDDSLAKLKNPNNGPREMLKRMLECEYTELGRKEIDGIEVEGFETTDPKFSEGLAEDVKVTLRVTLWVDVETSLPVLWETETKINEQQSLRTILRDFQWDIPVAASDFEPVIPADYTSKEDHYHELPGEFEEVALKRLRSFAEIFGRYPEKIDQESLAREFSSLRTSENLTHAGLRLREEMKSLDPAQSAQKAMDMSQFFQSIGVFYKLLVDVGKDPAYYGDKVSAGSPDDVLMRWKISDNKYRVIFGDLSIGNVTAEELAALE